MRYNPALDGIRALAVLLVIAFHCRVPGFAGGFFGVDVFFVLSGFLITGLLLHELDATRRLEFGRFYLRRFLRLGPPLALMLAAYLAAAPWVFPSEPMAAHGRDVAIAATYLSDYAVAFWHVPSLIGHTWSLSVEEHYYLLWPVALLAVFKLPQGRRVTTFAVLVLAAMLWRLSVIPFARDWAEVYFRFDTRLSGLLLGGLLAFVSGRIAARTATLDAGAALGAVAIAVSVVMMGWGYLATLVWGIPIVEIGSAALILAAADTRTCCHRLLSLRPLPEIGLISYALYLWHYPVARAVRDSIAWPETLGIVVTISFVAATASYIWIERPIRDYRRRLKAVAAAT